MSLDRHIQVFSVTKNLSSFGGASLSYFESGVSNIRGKDFNNEFIGMFKSKDSYLMFSFGSRAFSNFYIGLNIKALFGAIDDQRSSGFSGDIGMVYDFSNKFSYSFMINNIFSSIIWKESNLSEYLPQINSLGVRFNFNKNFKIHSKLEHVNSNDIDIYRSKNGLEWFKDNYSIRLGLVQTKGQFSNQSFDFKALIGFGMNISLLESNKIRLDYCIDFGNENEGISNLVSLSIK